jgi:flagellar biosynthesis protein FlhF
MKIKKFVAPTMPEVMKKIRIELGSDAVILNSKVVEKGGFFGFFSKKSIEVIAALDSSIDPNLRKSSGFQKVKHDNNRFQPQEKDHLVQADKELDVLKEIAELNRMMKQLSTGTSTGTNQYPGPLKEVAALLTDQGVIESIRLDLLNVLLEKWFLNGARATREEVFQWLHESMLKKLTLYKYGGISYMRKYINVVGPTGVGKTTTLAKIAAECVLKDHKKVGFITTDTYRIAAIDQLKTYASILGIPIEVCYNIEDFRLAKEKFADYDLVLIDTAGRNFRNKEYVQDLKEIIDFNREMETYLVLAMTSKYLDMKAIFEQFSLVEITKFIFTKVDETAYCGAMLNMIISCHIGAAYITNGQNVPDDMDIGSPQLVTNTVLGVDHDERSS